MDSLKRRHEEERRDARRKRDSDRSVLTRRLEQIERDRPHFFSDPEPPKCPACNDTAYVFTETKGRGGDLASAAKPCATCEAGRAIRYGPSSSAKGAAGSSQQELEGLTPVRDYKKAQGSDE